jgi:transposase-like protein
MCQTLSFWLSWSRDAGAPAQWPAEQKMRIVAESYASGETVCTAARF